MSVLEVIFGVVSGLLLMLGLWFMVCAYLECREVKRKINRRYNRNQGD